MRLTILGGSAAGANPGQGCSGYLIESGRAKVVIDLGPGTFIELRKHVDFRSLDGVIVSHLHLDHVLDLLTMRYALAHNPLRPRRKTPVWLPPGGTPLLGRLASAFGPAIEPDYFHDFEIREYDPNTPLWLSGIAFRFLPTIHSEPCWAMRVSDGMSGDLVYTADTGPATPFLPFASGAKVLVAEAGEGSDAATPSAKRGHLTAAEAGWLARDVGAEFLVLTHLWMEHDPFASQRAAREAFGGRVELAAPGLALSW
jgi:ribonuclease BN (tRNA processing enzyme)